VDKIKREGGISDTSDMSEESPTGLEPETLRRLEAERVPLQAGHERLSQLLAQLKSMRSALNDATEFRQALLKAHPDAELSKLLQDLWATEAWLARERVSKGPEHPYCRALSAMQSELETTINERVKGILRGLEVRAAAYKAQLEYMDKAVKAAKAREAEMTARYRPYFAAKRDLENQQKIRDAILLRKLQETVDLQIPRQASLDIVDPAEPSMRPVQTRSKLGLALCAAGLATGLSGLLLRGSARPPKL
jgi:uncharacterized protein involved in exopolysaccharide biosynthesis